MRTLGFSLVSCIRLIVYCTERCTHTGHPLSVCSSLVCIRIHVCMLYALFACPVVYNVYMHIRGGVYARTGIDKLYTPFRGFAFDTP